MANVRPMGNPTWRKGVSGNPSGRAKTKPVTDQMRAQLDYAVKGGRGRETYRVALVNRMFEIALHAEPKESVKMIELILKYLEGLPQQTVELQFEQALQGIAARSGAPLSWIRDKARALSVQYAIDGEAVEVTPEPVQRTGESVAAVRRVRE